MQPSQGKKTSLSNAHGAPRCMTDIRITFSPTNWSLPPNLSSILVVSTEKLRNPGTAEMAATHAK